MCWGWRMSKPSVLSGSRPVLPAAATGGSPFSLRLASTYRQATWSIATGSVAKNRALFSQVQSRPRRRGPSLKHPLDPVHDLQDALLADDRVVDDLRDELVAHVGIGRAVRAIDVVDQPVAHVLECPGDAGRAVVFQDGQEHDLVDPASHEQAEVRAPGPVVLGVQPAPTSSMTMNSSGS